MKPHHPSIPSRKNSQKGFTIIEILAAIACIAILTAMMVSEVSDVNGAATNAKNMRNAQNMASMFQTAGAAGLDFYDPDLAVLVSNLVTGGTVNDPSSPYHGATFSMDEVSEDGQLGAQTFLVLDTVGRSIMYDSQAIP